MLKLTTHPHDGGSYFISLHLGLCPSSSAGLSAGASGALLTRGCSAQCPAERTSDIRWAVQLLWSPQPTGQHPPPTPRRAGDALPAGLLEGGGRTSIHLPSSRSLSGVSVGSPCPAGATRCGAVQRGDRLATGVPLQEEVPALKKTGESPDTGTGGKHQSAIAAVTNNHKLSSLKQHKLVILRNQKRGRQGHDQGAAGLPAFERPRGRRPLPRPASGRCLSSSSCSPFLQLHNHCLVVTAPFSVILLPLMQTLIRQVPLNHRG